MTVTDRHELARYWDKRYRDGRDSGEGSRGPTGRAKAEHVNAVIARHEVRSVIDWGCGDGQVLAQITPDVDYLGVDVSPTILAEVRAAHPARAFSLAPSPGQPAPAEWRADMGLSMDVMFHLVDDRDYRDYLARLFGTATRVVVIYSTDHDGGHTARHVLRRHWTPDIAAQFPDWDLTETAERADEPGFYLYTRSDRP